nr:hypothetical protein [Tanacetum cinerariifolium]
MEAGSKDRPPMLAPVSEGSPITTTVRIHETYKNVSQEIRDQLNVEAEAVQIILTGIDNDIYSTVDACPNACEMWKAIEKLKQGESINVQDLETNLYWEFGKFTSQDVDAEDDETLKKKEIDKLVALISLSSDGYENQRTGNVAGAREYVGSSVELEAHYMYMAQLQEVSLDAADSGPIFDDEPLQKVSNDDHYNVEEIDQNDDDNDLAKQRELLASLIEKLKCEIDESKNRNKFLETSNKVLIEKLKEMKDKLSAHQETIFILSQQKEAHIKLYKTQEDKELEKVIELEKKVKVLDNIVYKTGQSVQTMYMLNNKCRTSFAKPEFLKKAQRANPRLYDIGCYNNNLALMLAPDSDEVIRLEKESRSIQEITLKQGYHCNNLYHKDEDSLISLS